MKKSQLRKIIRESIRKMMLNEVQCPCYVGTNQSPRVGLFCYGATGIQMNQGGCCGNSMGSWSKPLHPLCNAKSCNSLNYGNSSHGCWDNNPSWGSVIPGGTPTDKDPIEYPLDLEIDPTNIKKDPINKGKGYSGDKEMYSKYSKKRK
tara:strand:- start:85 stop:528 length:444 start_codon:yes stop_codon:yes gene_type:complete